MNYVRESNRNSHTQNICFTLNHRIYDIWTVQHIILLFYLNTYWYQAKIEIQNKLRISNLISKIYFPKICPLYSIRVCQIQESKSYLQKISDYCRKLILILS